MLTHHDVNTAEGCDNVGLVEESTLGAVGVGLIVADRIPRPPTDPESYRTLRLSPTCPSLKSVESRAVYFPFYKLHIGTDARRAARARRHYGL